MVGGVLPGWSLVLLLFLLCVEVLRVLDGEQLAFGAPVSSGSGSFSSRCVDGEAMVSAMRVGDFVLRLRLRCVAVSFCGGGSELVGWCVRVAARRFKVLFASFDAMLKLLRPAMVARGGVVVSACSVLTWLCVFVLRPAVVARGEGVAKACFGSVLLPVQGRRSEGGCSGAGSRSSASGAGSRSRTPWPMLVQCFRSRRLTAGGSSSSKAWRCSPCWVWWSPAFLPSPGVAGVWEWRQASRRFSSFAVVLDVQFRLFWRAFVICNVLLLC